jgi:hypothetical protein
MQHPGLLVGAMFFAACSVHAPPAVAHFQGLQVVEHATVTVPAGTRKVYRIYAVFSEGSDQLLGWGNSSAGAPTEIHTGPCGGAAFFNPAAGGNTAPSQATIDEIPAAQWDTFATIGVNIADQGVPFDGTTLTPGFPTFIAGNQVTLNNTGVAIAPDAEQSRADFAGDGDPELRVLMAQLTTEPDEYPYGTIGFLQYRSGGQNVIVTNLTWIGLAAHGRCCVPDGTCVITYHSSCAQFINGYFAGCEPCKTCEGTCVPDVAPHPGDGEVNIDDLLAVISAWGPCAQFSVCPPDVAPAPSGNNIVDIDDLLAVISGWGPCP